MRLTIVVPVDPGVKKFLENHPLIPKPFELSSKIPAWRVLESLTEPKSFNVPIRYGPETTVIEVLIPNDNNKLAKPYVPPAKAYMFSQSIKKMMIEKMMDFIYISIMAAGKHGKKVYVHALIREFAEQFSINEKDWSFDAMVKDYQRYREKYFSPLKKTA
jgi:hypothetical protein